MKPEGLPSPREDLRNSQHIYLLSAQEKNYIFWIHLTFGTSSLYIESLCNLFYSKPYSRPSADRLERNRESTRVIITLGTSPTLFFSANNAMQQPMSAAARSYLLQLFRNNANKDKIRGGVLMLVDMFMLLILSDENFHLIWSDNRSSEKNGVRMTPNTLNVRTVVDLTWQYHNWLLLPQARRRPQIWWQRGSLRSVCWYVSFKELAPVLILSTRRLKETLFWALSKVLKSIRLSMRINFLHTVLSFLFQQWCFRVERSFFTLSIRSVVSLSGYYSVGWRHLCSPPLIYSIITLLLKVILPLWRIGDNNLYVVSNNENNDSLKSGTTRICHPL